MLQVVPLGGLGEIGLNAMVFVARGERLLVDCGLMFPHGDLPGVDVVLPDFSWLQDEAEALKGVVLTHAHEDHIGALPWFLRAFPVRVPVYGTRFTLALARAKLSEAGVKAELIEIAAREPFRVGSVFTVEAVRVTHSVPDAVGLIVQTPDGTAVHSGDFKLDPTPVDGQRTDLQRLGEAGERGVDLLMSDSTNATVPGRTPSEQLVADTFGRIFADTKGRLIVSLFGSHVHRVGTLVRLAQAHGRKVILAGRSLDRNVGLAREVGALEVDDGLFAPWEAVTVLPPERVLIIATGAQAEPRSALMTMLSADSHALLRIVPGDTVVVSGRVIPGNEPAVSAMLDRVLAAGARLIDPSLEPGIHVSGHAARDEQRELIETIKPKLFLPIHGELRHLHRHLDVAALAGLLPAQRLLMTDGDRVGIEGGRATLLGRVKVGLRPMRRDSEGILGPESIAERRGLADEGVVVIAVVLPREGRKLLSGPLIDGRGLPSDAQAFLPMCVDSARENLHGLSTAQLGDDATVREELVRGVRRVFKQLAGRRPPVVAMVLRAG